jgi:hypothetical protein
MAGITFKLILLWRDMGGGQGTAVAIGVGDDIATPNPDALVLLREAGMGLTDFVRVRPAKGEAVVGIQAELVALAHQLRESSVHSQVLLRGSSAE